MSAPAPVTPATVAVVGSCATRDNFNSRFNADWKRWFTCPLSTNQSSMLALMSPPVDEEFTADPGFAASAYGMWNVRNDLNRELLTQVVEEQPDHLVLDFFGDIHFGVLRMGDGRFVTDNRWKLHRTDLHARLLADPDTRALTIFDDTEDYLALWRESMDRFAAHLAEHCPETVVTVHRGMNVDRALVPGRPRPQPLRRVKPVRPIDVPRSNELWAELDEHCLRSYGWESIDLRAEDYTSHAEHPWGPFYTHFTMDYYHRFLAELHKIHLRHHGADESAADTYDRLVFVESATREREEHRRGLEQRLRRQQAGRLTRARARVEELEGLSAAGAVRYAVGKRLRARAARKDRS